MPKLDLRKELKQFYSAKKKPQLIDVTPGKFLTYHGKGAPGGEAYQEALQALYGAAYKIKFKCKAEDHDFTVMALEGLWWWDDRTAFTLADAPPRETWNWISMIRMPDYVSVDLLEALKPSIKEKRGDSVDLVKLEEFHEGLSAQIMYRGPFSEEQPTVDLLHSFIEEQGFKLRGHHHEIYLSDFRRSKPENLKTIIRHPIEKA